MNNEYIQETIKEVKEKLATYEKMLAFLTEHENWFAENDLAIVQWASQLDINNPTREQVLLTIKKFPGKWVKSKEHGNMSYTNTDISPILRLWNAELPPTCTVTKKTRIIKAEPERVEEYHEISCAVPVHQELATEETV